MLTHGDAQFTWVQERGSASPTGHVRIRSKDTFLRGFIGFVTVNPCQPTRSGSSPVAD